MGNLFAELKRRHIYRVAAAYAVVAWVLLQLVNNVAPILDLPVWVARSFLLLLVIGFPAALFFAWMHQLSPADGATKHAAGRLDWALMGALVVVIGLVSYQQLAPSIGAKTARQPNAAPPASPQPQPGGISIAVLPFANVSGDASQEFFSDGMTDEIMTALAKVKGLTVLARTSVFEYKGQNRNARDIGQALGAVYLVEGSVRKAGDQVRITAQLVQADNGASLWTESYDRELKNIFATQSDIALAIAGALRVPLGLDPGESLVSNRTADLDSYEQYLRARALLRARSIDDAITVLEGVTARDPDFAPAWAMLSFAYVLSPRFNGTTRVGPVEEARRFILMAQEKAEAAAQRAVRLDPKNATGYGALGAIASDRGQWAEAEDLFRQSQAFDPNDAEVLNSYVSLITAAGRTKEASISRQRLRNLEPLVPPYVLRYATDLLRARRFVEAIAMVQPLPADLRVSYARNTVLAEAYANMGRFGEAADTLLAIVTDQVSRQSIEDAARLLRTAPAMTNAPEKLPVLEGALAFVYYFVGAPERLLDQPERRYDVGVKNFDQSIWDSKYSTVRKGARFKSFARKVGLVDYWKARGWPDLCRPMGADDFVCD